jgi:hypothetical protein
MCPSTGHPRMDGANWNIKGFSCFLVFEAYNGNEVERVSMVSIEGSKCPCDLGQPRRVVKTLYEFFCTNIDSLDLSSFGVGGELTHLGAAVSANEVGGDPIKPWPSV